jgi:polyisoprenoid-binding protein YceI
MVKQKLFIRLMLWMGLMCIPLVSSGQTFNGNENSGTVEVSGTSSLHDWKMDLNKFEVSADLEKNDNDNYIITNASFSSVVEQLTSEKSMMENKAHEALKSDTYPKIVFHQTKENVSLTSNNNSFQISGDLQIAGKTKPVEITLTGKLNEENHILVTGNISLQMTDFSIKPPTVMFGTIKTGDEVSVKLNLTLKPNQH